jgi:hypothetical protein
MSEPRCDLCHYFAPAYTCMDKPAWGHCMWPACSGRFGKKGRALFTWADDRCANYRAKQRIAAKR